MHGAVTHFAQRVKALHPEFFESVTVYDFGARNVNGNLDALFTSSTITHIDAVDGRDVDVVCFAHDFKGPMVDTVMSTEMLEHDPHWEKSLVNMALHLRPGGLFFLTCATTGRGAHGHLGRDLYTPQEGYYGNRTAGEVTAVLKPYLDNIAAAEIGNDLQFYGRRKP